MAFHWDMWVILTRVGGVIYIFITYSRHSSLFVTHYSNRGGNMTAHGSQPISSFFDTFIKYGYFTKLVGTVILGFIFYIGVNILYWGLYFILGLIFYIGVNILYWG